LGDQQCEGKKAWEAETDQQKMETSSK